MKKETMGEIVDVLVANKVVCKRLVQVDNTSLKTRKKISCFLGVDTSSYYLGLWRRFGVSRFLLKEAEEFLRLQGNLEESCGHRILHNYLIIQSPICSKALHVMTQHNWKVLYVSV